jgi:hypothetical protein
MKMRKIQQDKYYRHIQIQAEKYPKKLIRQLKPEQPGATDTATTKQGLTITTLQELSKEAQTYLKPIFHQKEAESPMGHPQTPEPKLTATQKVHRSTFQRLLQKHAATLTATQTHKIEQLAQPTCEEEIRNLLQSIKRNSYAPETPMVLFKELPQEALKPLVNLINRILEHPTEMPSRELEAHLILLPKDEHDPTNLAKVRPITMCKAFYKIIARLYSTRIMRILEEDSFLLNTNVGFTPHGETHHLVLPLQAMYDINTAKKTSGTEQQIHTPQPSVRQSPMARHASNPRPPQLSPTISNMVRGVYATLHHFPQIPPRGRPQTAELPEHQRHQTRMPSKPHPVGHLQRHLTQANTQHLRGI